jgi:GPH family glycoside/pentoside/hexuronide:cation symporter
MALTLKTKLSYGAGDLGTAITANLIAFFILIFYTDTAGLSPAIAGSILFLGKLWDAINDPIIGYFSDKTRTRWGRRRPWILFGAIPFGVSYALLWWIPFPDDKTALAIYYFVTAILFNTFYTVVNLPYSALTPELTDDYDERTSLNNYRFAFSIGGSILSAVLQVRIVQAFGRDGVTGNLVAGIFWAIVAIVPLFICFWGTSEKKLPTTTENETLPYWQQVKIAFSNIPFLHIIGIYICSWLALQATATVIPYYVTYWIRPDRAGDVIPMTILAVQGSALSLIHI